MNYSHVPVLLDDCLTGLNIKPDGIYADGTVGGGGHASEILKRLSEQGTLVGIDRDKDALEAAGKKLEGVCAEIRKSGKEPASYALVKSNYS